MHVLTKMFVALAAVLSVALAALTMAYAVNADRVADGLLAARAEAQAAGASLQNSESQHATRMDAAQEQINSLSDQLQDARRELEQIRDERSRIEGELASAQRARTAVENQLAVFGQGFETQSKLIATLNSENTALRESDLRSRREALELADQLNDAEGRFQVAVQTIRNQELVIADLRDELQGRGTRLSGGRTGGTSGSFTASGTYSGQVTAVNQGNEETLVEINVGTNEGLSSGAQLFVTRGTNWIANIEVIQADLNASVARIQRTAPNQAISRGDRVVPSLR